MKRQIKVSVTLSEDLFDTMKGRKEKKRQDKERKG